MTSDVAAAADFYGKVFGWTFETYGGDDDRDTYTLALADGLPIGGMVFDQRAMKGKTPSARWVGLISVADVKAATAAVTAGGGKVVYAPVMLGERGETAVFKDPEGVVFGVVNSKNGDPLDYAGDLNEWYWVDLWTADVEKAAHVLSCSRRLRNVPIADDGPRSGLRLLSGGFARAGIMQKNSRRTRVHLAALHSRRRRKGIGRGGQGRGWQGAAGTGRDESRDGGDHRRSHRGSRRHRATAGPGGAAMSSRNDVFLTRPADSAAVAAAAMTLAGCASDGGDSSYSGVSTSVSVGYGYGGYYGGGYYPGTTLAGIRRSWSCRRIDRAMAAMRATVPIGLRRFPPTGIVRPRNLRRCRRRGPRTSVGPPAGRHRGPHRGRCRAVVAEQPREPSSILVEHLLDPHRIVGLRQRQLQQHARLGRIQLTRGDEALLVVVDFVVAQRDARSARRVLRTTTTPFFAALVSASSAGVVMLPSPTPATTMPLAPFLMAASIRSALMFACA